MGHGNRVNGGDPNGWIGVDLDRTLAHYGTFRGVETIGEPIPHMVERVKKWLAEGRKVRLFTARARYPEDMVTFLPAWEKWSLEHLGEVLPVTKEKDFQMICLWDDRARSIEPNTGWTLGEKIREKIAHFEAFIPDLDKPLSRPVAQYAAQTYAMLVEKIKETCREWDAYYEKGED